MCGRASARRLARVPPGSGARTDGVEVDVGRGVAAAGEVVVELAAPEAERLGVA